MQLPEDFTITITGRKSRVIQRENIAPNIGQLLAWFLTGHDLPEDFLRSWSLQVDVKKRDA